jgi:hypothetical protein
MDEIEEWDPVKRKADGTLGDTAHSNKVSDHNPDENGVVRACDAGEKDDAQGDQLAEALRASKDDRIAYVIHDGRRFMGAKYGNLRGRQPWVWIPYTGPNAHLTHNHTSVNEAYDNDASPWDLGLTQEEDMPLDATDRLYIAQQIDRVVDLLTEGQEKRPILKANLGTPVADVPGPTPRMAWHAAAKGAEGASPEEIADAVADEAAERLRD